jgi:ATP-dependent protease ClpP protease subunit
MEIDLAPKKCSVFDEYVPIITEGRTHHVYLYDGIDLPSNYCQLIHMLNAAHTGDEFIIHLNTPGGVVDSGIAIRNAIMSTKAKVTAKMTGTVASAGTMIALACHSIEVTNNLSFMCHEISIDNIGGKFSDIKNMQDFYEKQFSQLSHDVYDGFLTEDEIEKMHNGKELWYSAEEVLERWKNMTTK